MNKQEEKEKKGTSPLAAAITGAVVGAGVAVAGAVALQDEKNRGKVKKAFNTVKNQAMDYIEDMQKGDMKEKLAAGKKEVTKVAKSLAPSSPKKTKSIKKTKKK